MRSSDCLHRFQGNPRQSQNFVKQWIRACLAQIRVATWDEDRFWCQALVSEGLATYDSIWKHRPAEPGADSTSPAELSPEEQEGPATQPKLVDPTNMGKLQQYYGRSKRRVAHFSLDLDHADESTSSAAAADLRGATSAEVETAREAQGREHRAKEAAKETRFGVGPSLDRIRMAELDVEKALREVQERIRRQKRLCSYLEDVDNPDPKLVNMRVRAGKDLAAFEQEWADLEARAVALAAERGDYEDNFHFAEPFGPKGAHPGASWGYSQASASSASESRGNTPWSHNDRPDPWARQGADPWAQAAGGNWVPNSSDSSRARTPAGKTSFEEAGGGTGAGDPALRTFATLLENQTAMFAKIGDTFREFTDRGAQGRLNQPHVAPFKGDEDPRGYLGFRIEVESVFTDMRWGDRAKYQFLFNCLPPEGGPRMAAQNGVKAATREGRGDDYRICLDYMWRHLRKEYGKASEETQIEKEWETLQQFDPSQGVMRTASQFLQEIKKVARRWEWAHGAPVTSTANAPKSEDDATSVSRPS